MTQVSVISLDSDASRSWHLGAQTVRRQTHPDVEHVVVCDVNAGLHSATGDYACILEPGQAISKTFLARAAHVLDVDPHIAIVAPGRPRRGGRDFDLGAHLIRDGLPSASVFRRHLLPEIDVTLRSHARWDGWLQILGTGHGVAVLPGERQGGPSPWVDRVEDDDLLATVMQRHLDLYVTCADEFWRAVLDQRAQLADFKRRFGRVEDAISRAVDLVRGNLR